jgi:UbiD family decarboxylase
MAAIQGVRDFLEVLEKNGQLLRIAEEVSLEPDIGAAGRAISQLGETMPALSFEKIKGYKSAHIVTNIHGSWPNHALAMGMAKGLRSTGLVGAEVPVRKQVADDRSAPGIVTLIGNLQTKGPWPKRFTLRLSLGATLA